MSFPRPASRDCTLRSVDLDGDHSRLPQVMVCHPGRQHSHQLAMALAQAGMLCEYVVGVPSHPDAIPFWMRPFMRRALNAYSIDIDPQKVTHNFSCAAVRGIAGKLFGPSSSVDWKLRGNALFDLITARRVATARPDIVVGYERGSLELFRAAKQINAITVLDAASFHHAWQDRYYEFAESPRTHSRVVDRKDSEICLADHVFTVSDFARTSYIEAGVSPDRTHSVPMGTDLQRFSVRDRKSFTLDQPVKFVFVGHVERRKGADVLHAAARRLVQQSEEFRLSIVGKYTSSIRFEDVPGAAYLGWIPQQQLPEVLRQHDVLVLPSRHDSFGMVVAEAMACGLSVIVSENVGAKEMVQPERNGLVIPYDRPDALADAMQWFIRNRSRLAEMSQLARAAAERYDWTRYRERVVTLLTSLAQQVPC